MKRVIKSAENVSNLTIIFDFYLPLDVEFAPSFLVYDIKQAMKKYGPSGLVKVEYEEIDDLVDPAEGLTIWQYYIRTAFFNSDVDQFARTCEAMLRSEVGKLGGTYRGMTVKDQNFDTIWES